MKRRILPKAVGILLALWGLSASVSAAEPDVAKLYTDHCAECHGSDRLGGLGPALLPESLERLRGPRGVAAVIAQGRNATQMEGFATKLSKDEIAALAAYVTAPLASIPTWGAEEINNSRVIHATAPKIEHPSYSADPLNLFVVVETGDQHATILDGDHFEPLARFETRFALHGGPKFTPDGRYVFLMSRDGWVSKYDLWSLTMLAEVRAGINSRNIAISRDGKHIAVANYLPHSLVILSADDLSVEKIFDAKDKDGNSSRVSAVYEAPTRNSFIAALKDVPEIWEISNDPNAEPVYSGMVHSYEKGMVEGLASSKGLFALRRIEISEPLDDFFFDPPYRNLIGSAREGKAVVVNLTVGREVKQLDLPGLPHLGSGISWDWNGRTVMATPLLKEGQVSVIDVNDWSVIKNIKTLGPGFFMRSHENTPYAWTDDLLGPKKDTLTIIDKRTLEVARTLTPEPGKTAVHVEFDRDGSHALVSIWEDNGGQLIVYDAKTFTEVKRIPMSKPLGKYNVWNKTTFSNGTSH